MGQWLCTSRPDWRTILGRGKQPVRFWMEEAVRRRMARRWGERKGLGFEGGLLDRERGEKTGYVVKVSNSLSAVAFAFGTSG